MLNSLFVCTTTRTTRSLLITTTTRTSRFVNSFCSNTYISSSYNRNNHNRYYSVLRFASPSPPSASSAASTSIVSPFALTTKQLYSSSSSSSSSLDTSEQQRRRSSSKSRWKHHNHNHVTGEIQKISDQFFQDYKKKKKNNNINKKKNISRRLYSSSAPSVTTSSSSISSIDVIEPDTNTNTNIIVDTDTDTGIETSIVPDSVTEIITDTDLEIITHKTQTSKSKRMPKSKSKFYAVASGRNGSHIYTTWKECQAQVIGYPSATFKSFQNQNDAEHYIQQNSNSNGTSHTNSTGTTGATFDFTGATFGFATDKYTSTEYTSAEKMLIPKNTIVSSTTNAASSSMNNNTKNNTVAAAAVDATVDAADDADAAVDAAVDADTGNNNLDTTNISDSNKRRQMMNNSSSSISSSLEVTPPPISVATAEEVAAQLPIPIPPIKIWFDVKFDGGSRGNPKGHAGSGTYIVTRRFYENTTTTTNNNDNPPTKTKAKKANTIIYRDKMNIRSYLGFGSLTNNQAEYNGFVVALEQIRSILLKETIQRRQYYQHYQPQQSQQSQSQLLRQSKRDVTIVIQGDSLLIMNQMKGIYQCKSPKLKSYYKKAVSLLGEIKKEIDIVDVGDSNSSGDSNKAGRRHNNEYSIIFEHIYRERNKVADKLANDAMDHKMSWTTLSTTPPKTTTTTTTSDGPNNASEVFDTSNLQKRTVVELKEMLRERRMRLSGRKAELIERLISRGQ